MAQAFQSILMDMSPGLSGLQDAGRRCRVNMHEHLACSI